jgi:MFS family permease
MSVPVGSDASPPRELKPLYVVAWLLRALFYLYQYAARSAPGVMQDQLAAAWGGNHIGSIISAYYVAYALTALAAGLLLDRYRSGKSDRRDTRATQFACRQIAGPAQRDRSATPE